MQSNLTIPLRLLLMMVFMPLLSSCGSEGGNTGTVSTTDDTEVVADTPFFTEVYPSTSTAWVIPGYHADSYDAMGYPISTKSQLIDWELDHADIVVGSSYDKSVADRIINLGYMYIQKIDFSPTLLEFSLQAHAESADENYEDYFLHFSEDTIVQGTNPENSIYTPLNRRPWIIGWTAGENHPGFLVWQFPPYEIQPFQNSEQGGCVFIYMPEKFDQVEFVLKTTATTGRLVVKYPAGIDATTRVVNRWNTIKTNIVDGTNGLKTSGAIIWHPPHDWVKAATYDPGNETGQFFANQYIKEGKKSYVVKICRVDEEINDQPIVQDIMIKDFMPFTNKPNQKRLIRGWDFENDRDGDGYVDITELNSLVNPAASARFRYESRVTPLGNMWGKSSDFQRPDFLNPSYRTAIVNIINQNWMKKGLVGAYNDDVFKLDDVNTIGVGGEVKEYGIMIDDPDFKEQYQNAFFDIIQAIKTGTESPWVAANISAENIFDRQNNRMKYLDAFDVFLREDYIRPGQGIDGYFGIAKMWDTFVFAYHDKKTIIIAHAGWANDIPLVNTKSAWEARIATGLAMYYLINIPGKTSYTSWNKSYSYGSGNTVEGDFYKAGVPKNIAYQPSHMLAVDIGQPTQNIQTWFDQVVQPLIYTIKTTYDDYAIIGDSTQLVLTHPDIATFDQVGFVPVSPSHIYYAWQSEKKTTIGGVDYPQQMIVARDYTNGLILYHTDFSGGNSDFMSVTHELTLPGYYHRVNYDGTLQAATNTMSLTGYEGVVLVKSEQ